VEKRKSTLLPRSYLAGVVVPKGQNSRKGVIESGGRTSLHELGRGSADTSPEKGCGKRRKGSREILRGQKDSRQLSFKKGLSILREGRKGLEGNQRLGGRFSRRGEEGEEKETPEEKEANGLGNQLGKSDRKCAGNKECRSLPVSYGLGEFRATMKKERKEVQTASNPEEA